jgi:hypothetical protein
MMIDVETDALLARAADLDRTARSLASGTPDPPALVVSAPGWAAAAALTSLRSAVEVALGSAAADVARAAELIRAAADDYVSTDDRAARRLARVG